MCRSWRCRIGASTNYKGEKGNAGYDTANYRGFVIRGGSLAAMGVGALWLIERTAKVAILPM